MLDLRGTGDLFLSGQRSLLRSTPFVLSNAKSVFASVVYKSHHRGAISDSQATGHCVYITQFPIKAPCAIDHSGNGQSLLASYPRFGSLSPSFAFLGALLYAVLRLL